MPMRIDDKKVAVEELNEIANKAVNKSPISSAQNAITNNSKK